MEQLTKHKKACYEHKIKKNNTVSGMQCNNKAQKYR